MTIALRELLLGAAAQTAPTERVPLPELGDGVVALVRGMTGTDRDAYQASILNQRGRHTSVVMTNISAKLVARCLVDEAGARVFTDSDGDLAQVGAMRADLLSRLYAAAQRVSGLSQDDVEELVKGSASPSGTSGSSASPGTSGPR